MARPLVAYCGIDCAKCPAYRLPRLGEKLHVKGLFQRMLKSGMTRPGRGRNQQAEVQTGPEMTGAGYVVCDGCTTIDARCLRPCLECSVRCCAMETGVANCALCGRFPCERLQGIWKTTVFKDAQPRLEKLRTKLGSPAK